jgi:hypothetical protein
MVSMNGPRRSTTGRGGTLPTSWRASRGAHPRRRQSWCAAHGGFQGARNDRCSRVANCRECRVLNHRRALRPGLRRSRGATSVQRADPYTQNPPCARGGFRISRLYAPAGPRSSGRCRQQRTGNTPHGAFTRPSGRDGESSSDRVITARGNCGARRATMNCRRIPAPGVYRRPFRGSICPRISPPPLVAVWTFA